jgi:enamine deaminase RidA (YjgF/YER057c/UK114 family)
LATTDERMSALGIELPAAQPSLTDHASVVIHRGLAFLAGHGPMDSDRKPLITGAVGLEVTEERAKEAARMAAMNAMASLRAACGTLDRVEQVVRLTGYVLSAPGFSRQPWVVDGASELLVEIFGPEVGRHARTSIGVASSALNMSVTVDLVVGVEVVGVR